MPIIWHIMKTYSHWGVNRFIICAGYRSILLKEFFTQFSSMAGDVIIHANGEIEFKNSKRETWEITIAETGLETQTGGRLQRIAKFLDGDEFIGST